MPRTSYFEGRTIQVPDDTSDEEIRGILSQGASPMQAATPIQAANAKPVDPRFFAPMPAVASGAASAANTVDPRFLRTMDTPVAGEATDSGKVGQNPSASRLGMSLFYAARQEPGQYARLLHLQDLTGIPPIVSAGHEKEIQQAMDATRIDPHYFTTIAPNTAVWASDPHNAAVSGVDEILRLGRIEQNAAAMRAVPSLNTFLNRYGSAAIPTSADDLQMQAWKSVYSFWGPLGKGLVDPLVAAANQALARQHAGDTAYRATPRPEPATIAEEAQQATTPQTLQVYTPAAPTVTPLPTPAETAAPIVRYPADAMAAVTYTDGKPDDPALLADIQKQQATDRDAEQNRRDAEDAAFFDKLPRLIPKDGGAPLTITDDEKRHVQQIMAQVQSGQRDPRQGFSPEEQELLMRYGLIQGGGAGEIENPVAAAIGQALRDKLSDMSRIDQLALMAILPEEGVGGQIAKLFFGVGMARGVYQGVPAAWKAYESGDNPKAAYIATGALVDLGMLGLAARHEASRAIDGLGYEQDASDGLGEGAREAMGGSVATEPSVDSAFFENLSQAMAEAADSKLRGRAPGRFYQALQAIFQGHDSLQIPVEQFNDYFIGKSMDPAGSRTRNRRGQLCGCCGDAGRKGGSADGGLSRQAGTRISAGAAAGRC